MRLRFFVALLVLGFSTLAQTQATKAETKNQAAADYYKRQVRGIVLKRQDELMYGRILAFRHKGIIFKRFKQGPFYSPRPQYIPIREIRAFVNEAGDPLWGDMSVTKTFDFLKIRKYQTKIGLQYGIGQHPNSYTFSPLVPDEENYIQNLHSGVNIVGQVGLFLSPHYSVGLKYIHHRTTAEIFSLKADTDPDPDIIKDDIIIQNFMFDVGFHQSASRMVIFHAGADIGGLFYSNERHLADETVDIEGVSLSAVFSGGVDFLLRRNVALGFELSYLLGSIKDPQVSGHSQPISARQRLNRFDINAGVRFYF
ncbi:hypothetical protein JW998_15945 [candidate division KSB1 bacterium]|nr:hypothetical protein [candidate division KSB1 bacterium]